MRATFIVVAIVGTLILGACSSEPVVDSTSDPKTLAESMINGELATTIGLGPLVGACGEVGPLAVGSTFDCTATTEPGQIIQVQGAINPEGHIELTTRNLVSAPALPSFERDAAAALNNSVGSNFTAESVDCGSTAIVLPADFVLGCALRMPASGEVFDLTLTITELDSRQFSLIVGEQPRP